MMASCTRSNRSTLSLSPFIQTRSRQKVMSDTKIDALNTTLNKEMLYSTQDGAVGGIGISNVISGKNKTENKKCCEDRFSEESQVYQFQRKGDQEKSNFT